jgi:hypothetical protein
LVGHASAANDQTRWQCNARGSHPMNVGAQQAPVSFHNLYSGWACCAHNEWHSASGRDRRPIGASLRGYLWFRWGTARCAGTRLLGRNPVVLWFSERIARRPAGASLPSWFGSSVVRQFGSSAVPQVIARFSHSSPSSRVENSPSIWAV